MQQVKIVRRIHRRLDGAAEQEKTVLDGVRHDRGEKIYLQFKEIISEDMEPAPTLLTVVGDEVVLHRKGDVGGDMRFVAGESHSLMYRTPMGALPMEIQTSKVDVFVSQNILEIKLKYNLLSAGELLSEIDMGIRAE